MTITHHPAEALLSAYAAGMLDQGQAIAVSTHILHCPSCSSWVKAMEHVGGAVIEEISPAVLSHEAWQHIETRLDGESVGALPAPRQAVSTTLQDVPGLPEYVRAIGAGAWQWVAPKLQIRRLSLPYPSETRVFLLRSQAGTKLLPHAHTGVELTCVLRGSFSHDGGIYGPGDFDVGEPSHEHAITIGEEDVCISLVAMSGKLRLKGLLGRLAQPFVAV